MELCWIFCIILGNTLLEFSSVHGEACQTRADQIPTGRECRKSCVRDHDCRSKKKTCQCDGICGLSCIKKNQECGPLANIPHGRVEMKTKNKFGAVAQYHCEDGYKLSGKQARVCQGDGTWSGSIPQCFVDHNSGKPKPECSSPREIPNAVHDGSPHQKRYPLGTMLNYKCLPSYQINKDAVTRAWCVGDDSSGWVGPDMTCTNSSCPRLEGIDNGGVEQTSFSNFGSVARYFCNPGYYLKGVEERNCKEDKTWEGVAPTCEKDAGCERLKDIQNGWVVQDAENTLAVYHCNHGYHLAGREERKCLGNGMWEGVPPSCEKVTCGAPPTIENAEPSNLQHQKMYPSGHQLLYTCSHGYYADGQARAMCSGDGKWIGLTLLCTPRSCGFPGDVKNGWRTGYAYTYPNEVHYNCHDGYELIGDAFRQCQENGMWTGRLPTCEPVTCPKLFAPVYGHLIGSGTDYGTVIRFECEDGYKVIGSPERRCQSDKSWSGQPAKCEGHKPEEINCGWPSPFYNGFLIGHKTTVGATIFFSCNTYTTFEGGSFQTHCNENGEWSSPPPICWGQCQIPVIPNATLVEGGREMKFVDHGTVVQFQCEGGLVPKETSNMRCNNGTWSAAAECIPAPCHSAPPHVHNGMRIYMGQNHGFKAKYRCFAGYKLTGVEETYLTCEYGQWKGGRPLCEEFYCRNPGTITNGQVYKKGHKAKFHFKAHIRKIKHGNRLEYQCNAGYRIDGPGGATCVNGQWQPPLADTKCVPAKHPPFKKLWKPIPNLLYS